MPVHFYLQQLWTGTFIYEFTLKWNNHGRFMKMKWKILVFSRYFHYLVGGLEHDLYFSIYWEVHHPNWLIFFRGVETTNQCLIHFQFHIKKGQPCPEIVVFDEAGGCQPGHLRCAEQIADSTKKHLTSMMFYHLDYHL